MRAFLMAGLVAVTSLVALPAHAAFTVCNKASSPVNVAIAFETPQDVVSQGWWTIESGACEAVIPNTITQRSIYHYAMSTALNIEWAGAYNFCTQNSPQFRIVGSMDCEARNFKTTGFRQTDLKGQSDYTLDILGPAPVAATAPAAPTVEETPVVADLTPPPQVQEQATASSQMDNMLEQLKPTFNKLKTLSMTAPKEAQMNFFAVQMNAAALASALESHKVSPEVAQPLFQELTGLISDDVLTQAEAMAWSEKVKATGADLQTSQGAK